MAHADSRGRKTYDYPNIPLLEEEYDLIVVGAGISCLAAAYFYQQQLGKDKKILLLENHDDFGGHAKRNEFTTSGGLIISYGGSESFQSPRSIFSKTTLDLLADLDISLDELEASFDVNFYPDLGLSRGAYFDKKTFGVDKVVAGTPGATIADAIPKDRINGRPLEEFVADFPFNEKDKADLLALMKNDVDYLEGMTTDEKDDWIDTNSYATFLREKVGLSELCFIFNAVPMILWLSVSTQPHVMTPACALYPALLR